MKASAPGIRRARTCRRSAVALLLGLAALLASCGDDDDATTISSSTTSTMTTGSAPSTTSTPSTLISSTSTARSTTTPATTTPGTTTLPGEEIDGFAKAGDALAVMGVAHDDTLNVRAAPGTDQAVLAAAGPVDDDLVATGRARQLPNSIWYEVSVDGTTGWVRSSFVGFVGGTDDFTAEFLAGGERPTAETMVDLGQLVAERVASTDPESRVVQSVVGSVGDLGEIGFDVIGIGDDSVAGYRLHVFAFVDEGEEAFSLRTIERTTLCWRGSNGELCV